MKTKIEELLGWIGFVLLLFGVFLPLVLAILFPESFDSGKSWSW